jgi:hypothetical protein
LKELSKSPVRSPRRRRGQQQHQSPGWKKNRKRKSAPAPPKSGEEIMSDYWSTIHLPDEISDSSGGEDVEEEERLARGGGGGGRNPTAVERLEWETLRTEMTIAEMNAERQLSARLENPEDDESSEEEEEAKTSMAFAAATVMTRTHEELEFYKSLIMPPKEEASESKGVIEMTTKVAPASEGPPSPLVRAMMTTTLDGDSDEECDEMNDKRWLAIDQSGEYMQEYERELRRELQGEL